MALADDRRSQERLDQLAERWRNPMYGVALLVIPAIILTTVGVPEPWATVSDVLNWLTWGAFAVELVVMLRAAPSRGRYLAEHPVDVVIVLFTVPLLASVFTSLRVLRLLRLLLILRLQPILRWMFSTGGLRYAALFALLVAVSAGYAYAQIEGTGLWRGFYWAISTMTTVGYGDYVPTQQSTQVLAVLIMLVGVSFVAVLTGALAERFLGGGLTADEKRDAEVTDVELFAQVEALSAQVDELRRAVQSREPL